MKHPRSNSPPAIRFPGSAFFVATAVLILAGCATTPAPPQPKPATEIQSEPNPPPSNRPAPKPKPVAGAPVQPAAAAPVPPPVAAVPAQPAPAAPEKLTIRVETHPQGAMIVVDGRPVGRAPIDIVVDSANKGFFKNAVTVRARFLATDENSETFSIDEQLSPLERVPLALVFSKDGVQRILRQF